MRLELELGNRGGVLRLRGEERRLRGEEQRLCANSFQTPSVRQLSIDLVKRLTSRFDGIRADSRQTGGQISWTATKGQMFAKGCGVGGGGELGGVGGKISLLPL